jgi:hypothetical protein
MDIFARQQIEFDLSETRRFLMAGISGLATAGKSEEVKGLAEALFKVVSVGERIKAQEEAQGTSDDAVIRHDFRGRSRED